MIAKATQGADFGGVLRYVLDPKKGAEVLHVQELFHGPDKRRGLLREMRVCAGRSGRCEKPVFHLSLSWAAADNPTAEQIRDTGKRFLDELGLAEHQALIVRHCDTDYVHAHIVVNRVHPDTAKARAVGYHRRLHQICRRLEQELRWQRVPSRKAHDRARPTVREVMVERKRGVAPLAQEINERCAVSLGDAGSWDQLEAVLAKHGYSLQAGTRQRQGLVFTDGKRQVSASRVRRDLSMPKLTERFGQTREEALQQVRPTPETGLHAPEMAPEAAETPQERLTAPRASREPQSPEMPHNRSPGPSRADRQRATEALAKEINIKCGGSLALRDSWGTFEYVLKRHGYELREGEGGEPVITDGKNQVQTASVRPEFSGEELTEDFGQSLAAYRERQARGDSWAGVVPGRSRSRGRGL